jgi:Polysaccharide lyase
MSPWKSARRRLAAVISVAIGLLTAGCSQDELLKRLASGAHPPSFSDTGEAEDPTAHWGAIDCETASRHERITEGGDPHTRPKPASGDETSFRRLRVLDGDDFYGERCELGENDHRTSPVTLYAEGEHLITFASFRLPKGFPITTELWQGVMQMKQSQPSENGGGTPVLSLGVYGGRWRLYNSDSAGSSGTDHEVWSAPATLGVWTRFALDVVYSQDASRGSIRVSVDTDGDGEMDHSSPTIRTHTLKRETAPVDGEADDGPEPGESIPSHLRVGLYHHEGVDCPPPSGCHVDVDNVQVVPGELRDASLIG